MKMKKKYTKPPGFSVEPQNVTKAVTVGDLRDLVFWVLSDEHGPPAPQWLTVRNRSAIQRIVTIMIPGLERPYAESELNNIKPRAFKMNSLPVLDHFPYVWPTKAPGSANRIDSALAEFSRVPLTSAEKKQLERERTGYGKEATYEKLLMTPELLKLCDYPSSIEDGWIELTDLDRKPAIYALDCEMVEVEGSERALARISVINLEEEAVYETFVKPPQTITNYLTPYSGITPEILKNVDTTLEDVQAWLKENLSKQDTLVGHSLEFDFKVLKLVHTRVIDTAVIFQHPRGLPWKPSLKWLAKRYLQIDIQTGNHGHDSAQDARTCVQLVAKKLEKGMNYGMQQPSTGIVEKLASGSLDTAIVDYGVTRWDLGHAKTVCSITSDAEAAQKAASLTKSHHFVYARFKELETALGWYSDAAADVDMAKVYAELNKNIQTVIDAVEPNTAVIIWSGQSNPQEMNRLQQKKRKAQEEYTQKKWDELEDPWTSTDDSALTNAVLNTRMGISFIELFKAQAPAEPSPLVEKPNARAATSDAERSPKRRKR